MLRVFMLLFTTRTDTPRKGTWRMYIRPYSKITLTSIVLC